MTDVASTRMIGIAGGSCAGKGYLCEHIQNRLSSSQCVVVPMDAYYKDLSHLTPPERGKTNFDVPDALDKELLVEQLRSVASGETVELPHYDFATHTRSSSSRSISAEGRVVLVEGLFALYWEELRSLFSAAVFINLDPDTCLARRVERDVSARGRTPQSVVEQFQQTVLPMYEKHVAPTQAHADLIVQGDAPIDELVARSVELISG